MGEVIETKERIESEQLVRVAFGLARTLEVDCLLVHADELRDIQVVEGERRSEKIIWLSKGSVNLAANIPPRDETIVLPTSANLSRFGVVRFGLFLAALNQYTDPDDSVVCLSGEAGSQRLDTLLIANPQRDFPWFRKAELRRVSRLVEIRQFARVLDIALRFAAEGREGKAIGTAFVIGDPEALAPFLRQLVLNPCAGHPKAIRSVHDPRFLETLREYSAMDGAFVIDRKGIVQSAGTYLDAPLGDVDIRAGLGARHAAAAAITAAADAIAVCLSESSGAVTVFHDGTALLTLEKPGPTSRRS